MKLIWILVAVASIAPPAMAANGNKKKVRAYEQGMYLPQPGWRKSRNDVYTDSGQYIGSDPDPFIRKQLRDEDRVFRRRN